MLVRTWLQTLTANAFIRAAAVGVGGWEQKLVYVVCAQVKRDVPMVP